MTLSGSRYPRTNLTCNYSGSGGTLDYSDASKATDAAHNFSEILVNCYILPCLMIIGVLCNAAFLYVVIRIHWMRNITNVYLTNLCIADMIFLLVGVGDRFIRYFLSPVAGDQYVYGIHGCIIINLVINTSHFGVLFFITLVTFERYYTICKPLHRRFLATFRTAIFMSIAAWCCSLVFAIVMVPMTRQYVFFCVLWPENDPSYDDYPVVVGHCLPVNRWVGVLANTFQTVPFFIAMVVNSKLYVCIFKRLNTMVEHRRRYSNADVLKVRQIRGQISRMLIANGIIFFVCVTPWTIYSLVFEIFITVEQDMPLNIPAELEKIFQAFRVLLYFNSVINPLLFNFASERYRGAFIYAFFGGTCCSQICCERKLLVRRNAIERSSELSYLSSSAHRQEKEGSKS